MDKANRNYTAFLLALVFLCVVESIFTINLANYDPKNLMGKRLFEGMAFIYGLYGAAIIATLLFRWKRPIAGRIVTKALNIVLLFFFPFGTAVGIYGLRKIDKESGSNGSETDPSFSSSPPDLA